LHRFKLVDHVVFESAKFELPGRGDWLQRLFDLLLVTILSSYDFSLRVSILSRFVALSILVARSSFCRGNSFFSDGLSCSITFRFSLRLLLLFDFLSFLSFLFFRLF